MCRKVGNIHLFVTVQELGHGVVIDATVVGGVIDLDVGAGGVAGQGVVEVAEGDGGGGADGLLETSGESVAEIDAYVLAPDVGVAGLVGVGGGDEECAGQALAGFAEATTIAGFDGEEEFAVVPRINPISPITPRKPLKDAAQAVVGHRLIAAEV